jgi:hypothetical protein
MILEIQNSALRMAWDGPTQAPGTEKILPIERHSALRTPKSGRPNTRLNLDRRVPAVRRELTSGASAGTANRREDGCPVVNADER